MMASLYKTMAKIKDIYERLHKDTKEYTELRFLIARRIFIIVTTAYFISLLFTIGGFYIKDLITVPVWSTITYHLYSLLMIAFVWFGFSIGEYFSAIYLPDKRWVAYIIGIIFFLFG